MKRNEDNLLYTLVNIVFVETPMSFETGRLACAYDPQVFGIPNPTYLWNYD